MVATARIEHRDVELAGGRVHFVEAGVGEALILVHGGHGSCTHWIANIAALAANRRVIALDLPGFGASFNPSPAYSIDHPALRKPYAPYQEPARKRRFSSSRTRATSYNLTERNGLTPDLVILPTNRSAPRKD